jgi:hypothetical protein
LSFAFDTNGEIDFIKPKIGFGQSIPVDIVLWRKPATKYLNTCTRKCLQMCKAKQ